MISAVCWVPKGAAKVVPEEVADSPPNEEIDERNEDSEEENDGEEMEVDGSEGDDDEVAHALAAVEALGKNQSKSSSEVQDIADRLNELMNGYDEEDDVPDCIGAGEGNLYYPSNDLDPYLQDKDDDEEEEVDDMVIKPTDAVIVCACTDEEDEYSFLQVSVYEESEDEPNMYTHQEKILSAFPLCTAWLDFKPESTDKGNFIAVGTMEPAIEIWDLDLIKEENPSMILGGRSEKSGKYKSGSHKGSVLGLAWNKEFRNVLASASADKSVKVWDLEKRKCAATAKHHKDKVQAVAWNQHLPESLLSGSFDRSVVMIDCRTIEDPSNRWSVVADVESLAWDPHNEHAFVVSLDNGTVQGFDVRTTSSNSSSGSKPSFTLHAHDAAVTSISYNRVAPNLLATSSIDKMVKLWDLSNNQPSCLASMNTKSGHVFAISFAEDSPFLLAVGGKKGGLKVWDILSEPAIARSYGKYSNPSRVSSDQVQNETEKTQTPPT